MIQKIGIGWQVGGTTGWGVYGKALMMQSARRGLMPVPMHVSHTFRPNVFEDRLLSPMQKQWFIEQQLFELGAGGADYPFLMGLGNDLSTAFGLEVTGAPDIGVVFFEHRNFAPDIVSTAKSRFPKMIAGSSWNAEVLRDLGFSDVAFCAQGIDTTYFHPAPRAGYLGDRFVVFSGGKLEFRKGQDIVIEAFRRFHIRHPDAVLMLAWHNHWNDSVDSIQMSPYDLGQPERDRQTGRWKFTEWLSGLGLPADSVIDLGEVEHERLPQFLRECDVGVFPNRSEGGTNLVAMECMACGVPSIIADNTGQRDLLPNDDVAYRLTRQSLVKPEAFDADVLFADWGESDPDEIVARLEEVYTDRERARAVGTAGAAFMSEWAWPNMIDALLREVKLID